MKALPPLIVVACCIGMVACEPGAPAEGVGHQPTMAQAPNGSYISWREHLIDDVSISGVPLAGSDGLSMADIDRDGLLDIVSVHESDTEYDGVEDGHVRISFGTSDPLVWESITLAQGPEAGAAEDAAIGDMNGDGWPDVIVAAELAHLIYFENPGPDARSAHWERLIPSITTNRGSFIRVFLADFDADGRPEAVAANKGSQTGDAEALNAISWFEWGDTPLEDAAWVEHELTRIVWPINSQPVDLDGDGDLDVIGGSMAESRIMWFENTTTDAISFIEHPIRVSGTYLPSEDRLAFEATGDDPTIDALAAVEAGAEENGVTGFNMDFVDLNHDGRLDIITNEFFEHLVWLEQPATPDAPWQLHPIGSFRPDQLVGLVAADIDGDGDMDVMTGGYSRVARDTETDVALDDALGRLAWFANPGDPRGEWEAHDFSRRKRGMFDKFIPLDMDGDGDVDFASTRGNSIPYDGVFWLEQVRTDDPVARFQRARNEDSDEMPLPGGN